MAIRCDISDLFGFHGTKRDCHVALRLAMTDCCFIYALACRWSSIFGAMPVGYWHPTVLNMPFSFPLRALRLCESNGFQCVPASKPATLRSSSISGQWIPSPSPRISQFRNYSEDAFNK